MTRRRYFTYLGVWLTFFYLVVAPYLLVLK